MKSDPNHDEDANLAALLHEWQVEGEPSPRFAETVWRRIGSIARDESLSTGELLRAGIAACLRQPRFAMAYLGVLLLAGAAAGVLGGRARAEHLAQNLQGRYVQSVDPFSSSPP